VVFNGSTFRNHSDGQTQHFGKYEESDSPLLAVTGSGFPASPK
jgi:hypothetical protein